MSVETMDLFIEWLDEQESSRGWTDYRLAIIAKISPSVLSRARIGVIPKWDACLAIASALNISPVTVFRKAGLLPDAPTDQVRLEDWEYLLSQMTPAERDEIREIGIMKIERRQKAEAFARAANFKPGKEKKG